MPVCKRFWRAGLKAPFSLSQSYLRSDTGCSLAARLQFLQHSAGTAAQPVEGSAGILIFTFRTATADAAGSVDERPRAITHIPCRQLGAPRAVATSSIGHDEA